MSEFILKTSYYTDYDEQNIIKNRVIPLSNLTISLFDNLYNLVELNE